MQELGQSSQITTMEDEQNVDLEGMSGLFPITSVIGAVKSNIMLQVAGEMLELIIPIVKQIVMLLHALWTPQARQIIPKEMRSILHPSADELRSICSAEQTLKIRLAQFNNDSSADIIRSTQEWLASLRECSYAILSAATRTGEIFYHHGCADSLISNVFSCLDSMSTFHLRLLIDRFLVPFVANCPAHNYNDVLLPILSVFIPIVFSRLSTEWLAATDEEKNFNDIAMEDQIIEDRSLRELTRSYVLFIANMTIPHAGYGVQGMTMPRLNNGIQKSYFSNERQSQFCAFVLVHSSLFEPIFHSLIGCLWWPDSAAARRSISILSHFVTLVCEKPLFHGVYFTVLQTLLSRLMKANKAEAEVSDLYVSMVVLVREIYLQFLPFSLMPREVFLSVPNMVADELMVCLIVFVLLT